MPGFALYTNKQIKKDLTFRWFKYFVDFTLTNKFHPKISTHLLKWHKPFEFNKVNRALVPKLPGIYLFFVKPKAQIFVEQSYVMYVGYSMNLWDRYYNYLHTYKNSEEPNYFERRVMLNLYEDVLFYTFIELDTLTETQIERLEEKIIDSLVPPINRDFATAIIKQQIRLNRP